MDRITPLQELSAPTTPLQEPLAPKSRPLTPPKLQITASFNVTDFLQKVHDDAKNPSVKDHAGRILKASTKDSSKAFSAGVSKAFSAGVSKGVVEVSLSKTIPQTPRQFSDIVEDSIELFKEDCRKEDFSKVKLGIYEQEKILQLDELKKRLGTCMHRNKCVVKLRILNGKCLLLKTWLIRFIDTKVKSHIKKKTDLFYQKIIERIPRAPNLEDFLQEALNNIRDLFIDISDETHDDSIMDMEKCKFIVKVRKLCRKVKARYMSGKMTSFYEKYEEAIGRADCMFTFHHQWKRRFQEELDQIKTRVGEQDSIDLKKSETHKRIKDRRNLEIGTRMLTLLVDYPEFFQDITESCDDAMLMTVPNVISAIKSSIEKGKKIPKSLYALLMKITMKHKYRKELIFAYFMQHTFALSKKNWLDPSDSAAREQVQRDIKVYRALKHPFEDESSRDFADHSKFQAVITSLCILGQKQKKENKEKTAEQIANMITQQKLLQMFYQTIPEFFNEKAIIEGIITTIKKTSP